MRKHIYKSEETRLRKVESCKKRMLAMTVEQRRAFAMIGVAARLAKTPPLPTEVLRKNRKDERDRLKREVIAHYGKACQCCGESNFGFLTIDHIDGRGAEHRRSINGRPFYRWLRKSGFPSGYQVLCYNCNCSKGMSGQCAHLTTQPR